MRSSLLSQIILAPFTPSFSSYSATHPQCNNSTDVSSVHILSDWHVLGPFQIGTREAEWGADPLNYYGGFQNLALDNTTSFKSSLTTNGTVRWSSAQFTTTRPGSGTVTIDFNSSIVDWNFLRSIYGWSGIQYQAWARGTVVVCSPSPSLSPAISLKDNEGNALPVTLQISPTLEYFVNKRPFFGGDMFSYHKAPNVLHLTPGVPHTLDIRFTHDIRASGGGMPPTLQIAINADIARGGLVADSEKAIVPDVVDGKLAGMGWVSLPLRNERAEGWIEVLSVLAEDIGNTPTNITFNHEKSTLFRLAPGQSRPLGVRITGLPSNSTVLSLLIQYRIQDLDSEVQHLSTPLRFANVMSIYSPHIFTFLHPSGIVSYATLRPPSTNTTCREPSFNKLPIILSLHGAGVDVHWGSAQDVYSNMPDLCAWLLLPQGVTLWSGDDWHIWGWADVEAAIASIPEWIESTGWGGRIADVDKWVVTGHSNGGQGTWYALTHRSDKIIAATPLSGYLSIPAYVPYHMWREADPKKSGLIFAAMNSYRHELLVDNIVGTPILQGHGALDDNVPTFHSRRMQLLAHEAGWGTGYIEFPAQGHWWEGVMTDGDLPAFLNFYVNKHPEIPLLPREFSIVVANPADMGSRGGVFVEQLEVYDQLGKIQVQQQNETAWVMRTTNIRRWRFGKQRSGTAYPRTIVVDNTTFSISDGKENFVLSDSGEWKIVRNDSWRKKERSGKQLGALDAFLNTSGYFIIVLPPHSQRKPYHLEIAVEIARNLYQYYGADSEIVEDLKYSYGKGNVVFVDFHDSSTARYSVKNCGICVQDEEILVRDKAGRRKSFPKGPGVGAIFLQPLGIERLAIMLVGADEDGLRKVARLMPLRTGVGQPNFVILGEEAGWKGVEGVLAMGMFDSKWQISNAFF